MDIPVVPTLEGSSSQASTTEATTVQQTGQPTRVTTVETVQEQRSTVGFLQDNEGHNSSMRLMAFVSLTAGIAFGLITLWHPGAEASPNGLYLTTMAWIGAFCPSLLQKLVEVKYPTSTPR